MKWILIFLFILMMGSVLALSDRDICIEVSIFLSNHPQGYNVLDIQDFNKALNISTESYFNDFYGKCISKGYINNLGTNPIQDDLCNISINSFFNASFRLPTNIYFGDLSCKSERNLNYIFDLNESKEARGVRFWLIIPFILLIVLMVYMVKKRKKKEF